MSAPAVALSGERPHAPDHPLALALSEAQQMFLRGDFEKANALLKNFPEGIAKASKLFVHGRRPDSPVASVVVVSHRCSTQVEMALEAIAQQCPAPQWEIILVENGNGKLFEAGERSFDGFVGVIVMFLDDDGIMEPGCALSLVSCLFETGAVAVRGRVVPLTLRGALHYDLGLERIPSFIDCEGVSGKLWRHHGPLAFVYEPSAVFRHDYARNAQRVAEKGRRYVLNRRIVESAGEQAFEVHAKVQAIALDPRQLYLATSALRLPQPTGGRPVSIITTARNNGPFLQAFSACWKHQTQRDFQLVFVDDGSTDGTADIVRELWRGDDRLTLIEQPPKGRGAALNAAFVAAAHDICMIADADDLSVPSRIARTVDFFVSHPEQDFLSFIAFNELDLFRIGPPASPFVSDMAVRSLFHMPASFPTFACRRQRFKEPFDESLKGGVDCDWLHRNMEAAGVRGKLVNYPAVYYGRHPGQITRSHNDVQWKIRKRLIHYSFSRVLGHLSEADKNFIDILVDIWKASAADKRKLGAWVMNLLRQNDHLGIYDPEVFKPVLLDAYTRIKKVPSASEKFQSLRQDAERHIAAGEYKKARRALRRALQVKDDPDVRSRLLAAHRFGLVRAFSRSRPFQPS